MDNYRPISLLPTFSKIYEKVVAMQLTKYLEQNNILSDSQFGFRSHHSTIHPLILYSNVISSKLAENKCSMAIFCDLKKAFDTCNHQILSMKLDRYGIRGISLDWFQSYLKDREQFVCLNGKSSGKLKVRLGVPQGSILGPLLFLLYINDLPTSSQFTSFLFADDTTLVCSADNVIDLYSKANLEFKKICDFFRKNKLVLHPKKTNYILYSKLEVPPDDDRQIFCNNNNGNDVIPEFIHQIERISSNSLSTSVKFLGVLIDDKMSFKDHVANIRKKLSKSLYLLNSVKNVLPSKTILLLYYSMFHSHLIYSIQLWSSTPQSLINSLFKLQKKAIRIVANAKFNAHTEPLFKKMEILPLPDLITYFGLQFMHRFTNNLLPTAFDGVWVTNERTIGSNAMRLRNFNNLQIQYPNLSYLSRLPFFALPRMWESFPNNSIKSISQKNLFDLNLKQHFLDDLSEKPSCNRLYCPSCSSVA
jgi:hypothetical protein